MHKYRRAQISPDGPDDLALPSFPCTACQLQAYQSRIQHALFVSGVAQVIAHGRCFSRILDVGWRMFHFRVPICSRSRSDTWWSVIDPAKARSTYLDGVLLPKRERCSVQRPLEDRRVEALGHGHALLDLLQHILTQLYCLVFPPIGQTWVRSLFSVRDCSPVRDTAHPGAF